MAGKDNEQRRSTQFHLGRKMEKLQAQLEALNAAYEEKPTAELFRQINLVEYHIECTNNRIEGNFTDSRIDYGVRSVSPALKTAI